MCFVAKTNHHGFSSQRTKKEWMERKKRKKNTVAHIFSLITYCFIDFGKQKQPTTTTTMENWKNRGREKSLALAMIYTFRFLIFFLPPTPPPTYSQNSYRNEGQREQCNAICIFDRSVHQFCDDDDDGDGNTRAYPIAWIKFAHLDACVMNHAMLFHNFFLLQFNHWIPLNIIILKQNDRKREEETKNQRQK